MSNNRVFPNTISVVTDGNGNTIDRRYATPDNRRSRAIVYTFMNPQLMDAACGPRPSYDAPESEWRAYTRRVVAHERAFLNECGLNDSDYAYSRTAGCSCGCSPGFLRRNGREADGAMEIYLTQSGGN